MVGIWAVVMVAVLGIARPLDAQSSPGPGADSWYRPPTSGPVTDPFRPPPEPWLPGNRGIEYATEPGSTITAIGAGTVAFAGLVAGRLVVSVVHPDGLRSSSTGLADVVVAAGQWVGAGQAIGLAAEVLHLGVRRGDRYIDPASLWGRWIGGGRAILVPDPAVSSGPEPAAAPPGALAMRVHQVLKRWW